MPETSLPASTLQLVGSGCFGAIIGWYLYFINRYRTSAVDLNDLTTVIAAIGGASVVALFPQRSDMFGAYGIGLAIGFFGYFLVLIAMVSRTPKFNVEFFLDGRRGKPADNEIIPEGWRAATTAMGERKTENSDSPSGGGPRS